MKKVIDNIAQSSTLPADFYSDPEVWNKMKENIFVRSWNYIGDKQEIFNVAVNTYPFFLLDNYLEEPLLLTDYEDQIRCMSNVCTHRGFILSHQPSLNKKLTCSYHGRRFNLDGQFQYMPEFKEVENFPRPCEHLEQVPLKHWGRFLFASLEPQFDYDPIIEELERRLGFLDFDSFVHAAQYDKTYNVNAHWALYCDNYLEGFHIPFVHAGLNQMLDYGKYETICKDHWVLQVGYADKGTLTFDFPIDHIDYGKEITAYYYWIFPNFMLNVYPWGVQLNVVRPLRPDFTKVEFIYYIGDQKKWEILRGDQIGDKVEKEDEWVVEGVQKGLNSRFYQDGRFSVKQETGVHHFHRLLKQYLG